jgi:hypothetical protein
MESDPYIQRLPGLIRSGDAGAVQAWGVGNTSIRYREGHPVTHAEIGSIWTGLLTWTAALDEGNIAESRAVPVSPSTAPVIPFEGDSSL